MSEIRWRRPIIFSVKLLDIVRRVTRERAPMQFPAVSCVDEWQITTHGLIFQQF